jgi:hypothetical protein
MDIQAHIPAALCMLHNFIWIHNPSEDPLPPISVVNDNPTHPRNADADESTPLIQATNTHHDHIATQMWEDYEAYLQNNILDDADFDEDVEIEDDLYQWHEFDEINTE